MKLAVALVVFAFACKSKNKDGVNDPPSAGSNVEPADDEDPPNLGKCREPADDLCSYAHCGGNSKLINAFPLSGFRPNGDCNYDEIQLVPGSMKGGKNNKCEGLTLDMSGDGEKRKLIGKNGTSICENDELEGATFKIRTTEGRERITITKVTTYTAPNGKTFDAYEMDWKLNNDKHGLCSKEGQKLRKKLGVKRMKWTSDLSGPDHQLVIVVQSELYTETGKPVDKPDSKWQDQSLEWIHLACVDDALAKRTINGHHKPAQPAFNRAALRMWTADYCGGRPFTLRGKMIDWSGNQAFPVEAQWNEKGATCLTKPRIIFENGKEVAPTAPSQLLQQFCDDSGKDCAQVKTWINEAKNCEKLNNAYKRVETIKDCGPCVAPNCLLESRNPI
jgi:hypothetical protein